MLIDTLGRARDAMELINNGLFSSMEYNAATMVASKHHGRKVVLNHCTQSKEADHIDQLENTKYNDEWLFGEMPLSAHCLYWLQRKEVGHVYIKAGPVRQEIYSGPPPGKSKKRTNKKSSYTPPPSGNNFRPLGNNFCSSGNNAPRGNKQGGAGGKGAAKYNQQKRAPQQNPTNTAKNNNGKKGNNEK